MVDLWSKYKEKADQSTRNLLLEHYLPLVKGVARKMSSSMPAHVQEEDLASYGVFGLIDAIEKYEPERGWKFETYAVTRIRGAILDELRSIDWAPRSVRAKKNAIDRVMTNYTHGLPPTEAEAAYFLGMSEEELKKYRTDEMVSHVTSMDGLLNATQEDDELTLADLLGDQRVDASSMLEYDHINRKIVTTLNLMPERERMLVYLYYFEQLTLADIGKLMKVTESRVCQIHTSICTTLRNALNF